MICGTLAWASQAMQGSLRGLHAEADFCGVSTDTRRLGPGEIFFCLQGKQDGHRFAQRAFHLGTAAVVMARSHQALLKDLPPSTQAILVSDTLRALGDLARAWRKKFSLPLIAIGGSNGKTTTKELLRAILETRYRVLATEGNFNNLLGVPKTLFHLSEKTEIVVIEMGMNDFGELGRLADIACPTMGVLTHIGFEHLEKLGDLDGVARAEAELFEHLPPESLALVNRADPYIARMKTPHRRFEFGTPDCPLWAEVLAADQSQAPLRLRVHDDRQSFELSLALPGAHNATNVLAALAAARQCGIPSRGAQTALEAFRPAASRMQLLTLRHGMQLLDDCYNANPSSVEAALQTLAQWKNAGKTMAVLGDMFELGAYAAEGHRQIGRAAAQQNIDFLVAVGSHAQKVLSGAASVPNASVQTQSFATTDDAIRGLRIPKDVRCLLIKGSRGMRLETLVQSLKERL